MNCPGCNKILAASLSVCPSCGTMIGDSVREELALKISPIVKTAKPEIKKELPKPPGDQTPPAPLPPPAQSTFVQKSSERETQLPPVETAPAQPPITVQSPPALRSVPAQSKPETAEITAKPTSPTLKDFRHQNTVVPEWRLKVQNAVRKRQDYRDGQGQTESVTNGIVSLTQPMAYATNGATALQAEPVAPQNSRVSGNSKLEAALRRIEQSRRIYGAPEEKPKPQLAVVAPPAPAPPKTFPYVVTSPPAPEKPVYKEEKFVPKTPPRTFVIEKKAEKFDTNKLPPLSEVVKNADEPVVAEKRSLSFKTSEYKIIPDNVADESADVHAYAEAGALEAEEYDEIEDCAPVSLRFNAGLFDLIIGSFLSFVLLAPFMLTGGNMFTFQGLLAFLATWAIVMFIYLTVTVGFLGRTFGMRLFALEIIDIEENEYPTFHQAAVNSCVYLISLALGGIGFLPLFFNSERRAAHDLLSGTIVVREEF